MRAPNLASNPVSSAAGKTMGCWLGEGWVGGWGGVGGYRLGEDGHDGGKLNHTLGCNGATAGIPTQRNTSKHRPEQDKI